jgi:hypothetical protein
MIEAIERLRGGRYTRARFRLTAWKMTAMEENEEKESASFVPIDLRIMLDFINFARFFTSYDGYDDVGDVRTRNRRQRLRRTSY